MNRHTIACSFSRDLSNTKVDQPRTAMPTVTTTRLAPLPRRTLSAHPMLLGRFDEAGRRAPFGKAALFTDRIELKHWCGWRWQREVIEFGDIQRVEWIGEAREATVYVREGSPRSLRFEEPRRWEQMLGAAIRLHPASAQRRFDSKTSTLQFA